jgi:transposase
VGIKVANPTNRPTRKGRPNHPLDFKRTLAQRACEPGVSVSKLAQEHGINANQLFKWRRHYRAGLLGAADAALLPVAVVDAPVQTASSASSPMPVAPAAQHGIEIAFADCTVRVGEQADMATLRAVVALLRR